MAAILNVAQQTICDRLKAMGKIQKCGNGCHMNRMKHRWKTENTLVQFCFKDTKENRFCIGLLLAMKNGLILRILNGKNHGLIRDNHQQNQIDSARRQCYVFGGTRKVWCTTSS